jgi:ubiquinone/menaquinone biosynthesis C-methylase UbiE
MKDEHSQFAGSIPAAYDRYLGPVLFQPYAEDLVARLQVPENGSVLELACGTGIVTRELRNRLPATVKLIATDLNEPMFQHAAAKFAEGEAVGWRQADACSLPFGGGIFDAVVCQFGIMFVPDKALAVREARRVLKPGGVFLFNVWDAIEHNEPCRIAHETIAAYFDKDPPTFYQVPFGYHDRDEIRRVLTDAGFQDVRIDVVEKVSGASRGEDTATGLVQGNPVSVAIAERDSSLLPVITNAITAALKARFGEGEVRAPLRAVVVEARG